jgi:dynein heavy chain
VHESTTVRHGSILLGPTCVGKTAACQLLVKALARRGVSCRLMYMNPLVLTPELMFGSFDPKSHEWNDGAFSAIWRKSMRASNASAHTWIVMDGPINTIWMEHLNTVLDETKMLSIANGDRMPLADGNKVVLEVDSLSNAAPSTVARTGLVNFPPEQISTQGVVRAWLKRRRPDEAQWLGPILDEFFPPMLEAAAQRGSSPLPFIREAEVHNCLALLEGLLADSAAIDEVPDRLVLERYSLHSPTHPPTVPERGPPHYPNGDVPEDMNSVRCIIP